TIAPAWMTISNSFARSPVKFSSDPATIRWPVEDTGRNSVRPSTRPRMTATRRSGAVIAYAGRKKSGRLAPPGRLFQARAAAPDRFGQAERRAASARTACVPCAAIHSSRLYALPPPRSGQARTAPRSLVRDRRGCRRQNLVDADHVAGVRRTITGQRADQLAANRACEVVDQRDDTHVAQVIAPQRQAVLFGSQRHEIETILGGSGRDTEPYVGLAGGD